MLVWPMAAKAPSAIEAIEMKTRICCQSADDRRERRHHGAHEQRHGRDLGRGREEGGDRRRRALIDIGRPHMERHGRNLEGEAGDDEDKAEDEAEARRPARQRGGDLREAGRAGEAIDQRGAIEQHAGGQARRGRNI